MIRYAQKLSREIEIVKQLADAIEWTYVIECDLKDVGPKADKEKMGL